MWRTRKRGLVTIHEMSDGVVWKFGISGTAFLCGKGACMIPPGMSKRCTDYLDKCSAG